MKKSVMTSINPKHYIEQLGFRPPYFLLDGICHSPEPGYDILGVKGVTSNEPFFQGHFPDRPIMPGVAQLEAIFQLATYYFRNTAGWRGEIPFLSELRRVKFRKPVFPGDCLMIKIKSLSKTEDELAIKGLVSSGEEVASEAEMVIRFYRNFPFPETQTPDHIPLQAPEDKNRITKFDGVRVHDIIPHRPPFIFLDKILYEYPGDEKNISTIVGIKNISFNEPYSFYDHPKLTFFPGIFQVEMIAQAGCVRTLCEPENINKLIYFISIDKAKFYQAIVPGDQVRIQATTLILKGRFGKGQGQIIVNERVIAEADIKFVVMER